MPQPRAHGEHVFMNCPTCREPLLVLELHDVEIDFCDECRAIWLDTGELELLLEGAPDKDSLLSSLEPARDVEEAVRNCPICRRVMDKVHCGAEDQVLLDQCPKGHGIWFDKGELSRVAAMAWTGQDSKVLTLLKELFASGDAPGAETSS